MSSQSSYVTNEKPNGLGLMPIRSTDLMVHDDRMILQAVDRYSSGGSTINGPTVIQPITPTTSVPQTGGSSPIVNPVSKPANENDMDSKSGAGNRAPYLQVDGDQLVINGTHRISKKRAVIIGVSTIGAGLLLKFIL